MNKNKNLSEGKLATFGSRATSQEHIFINTRYEDINFCFSEKFFKRLDAAGLIFYFPSDAHKPYFNTYGMLNDRGQRLTMIKLVNFLLEGY